ncbi:PREDICTED: uncharacterized protein LOC108693278 [Atta colombica]|uniref:uncharacterized protein LOC108693278 n=1 Tax=Atta colombica TaxID=520822 RepID=UPI00084BF03C|nr:PREDICTED: uncharacterized protein LOC108693278 [Atta colombica]
MRGTLVIIFVLMVLTVHSPVKGKIFGRCEIIKELQKAKISRSFFSNWICLMESESGMNTALMTGPKTASSYSYGILQINSNKWCARGRTGGNCNKRCEDFLNDDIQDDIVCAKKIVYQDGFKAWDGWMKKCKNKPLPDISNCIRRRRMVEIETDPILMIGLWIVFILMIVTVHSPVEGKIYTQCEAARQLVIARISRSFISNWVCLMKYESGMNTHLVTGPKRGSSYSYGILQINSAEWCTRGHRGGNCDKRCEDYLSDDIQEDIVCAKKIFDQHGFKAWDGWVKNCKNKPLPNLAHCFRRKRMAIEVETELIL